MERFTLIIAGLFLLVSCNSADGTNTENSDSAKVTIEKTVEVDTLSTKAEMNKSQELGKEYTAKYICPDHCKGSGSDKEGECPNCEMELMENPNYQGK